MPRIEKVVRPWEQKTQPRDSSYRWGQPVSRGGVEQRFYRRAAWRKLRASFLSDNPLCAHCEEEGKVTPATMVDHIKPIRLGGEPLDEDNLQSLCERHHAIKSAREGKMKKMP